MYISKAIIFVYFIAMMALVAITIGAAVACDSITDDLIRTKTSLLDKSIALMLARNRCSGVPLPKTREGVKKRLHEGTL